MTKQMIQAQTAIAKALRSERGELGSSLIFMAVLVAAAVLIIGQFDDSITGVVDKITGGIGQAPG